MRKHIVEIEWQILDEQRDGRQTPAWPEPTAELHVSKHQPYRRYAYTACLGVLLLLAGAGLWYQARAGIEQLETELQTAVATEVLLAIAASPNGAAPATVRSEQSLLNLTRMPTGAELGDVVTAIEIRDFGEDWAVIEVLIQPSTSGPRYRQTRVYGYDQFGWKRAEITAAYWGKARQLASRYFVFHYYALDHEAVTQAAVLLDRLYPTLYGSFFTDTPAPEKAVIIVDPEWEPGELPRQSTPPGAMVVASPAAIFSPAALAPSELVAQSVMLVLFETLAKQAAAQYDLPPQWLPWRDGMRLWLIWEQELPLAVWREPLVQWVFEAQSAPGQTVPIPKFAHDLCLHHQLWVRAPVEVGVSLRCWQQAGAREVIVAWRDSYPFMKIPLPWLADEPFSAQELRMSQMVMPPKPAASAVALATVVEYTVTTFGRERLPVLLGALAEHKQWQTLIPAVFGLSLAEFESGWQAFLTERYNLTN